MLVDTPEGIVNTDHIVGIVPTASGNGSAIRMADGTTRVVRGIEMLERACGTIVPAYPGFDVIVAFLPSPPGETGIVYSVETVIAFRVCAGIGELNPVPITLSGEPSARLDLRWTVRQPNGACFGPDAEHDDLAAFKADCERTAARQRQAAV